ncbi:A disintegrin and metalloproteinase with thrombospondin motifs 18-like [Chelonus insularis]|uniref:A disintegrin and metalloproteinase with thrombospondin motifs 18-like n=1 Tax=Chelonus insularis TaxID=460826 RepID=UPI00158CAB25|nr:A disintegrin and metalloproteinase with thrombospondin motifs 18-like [Chelonus insularis]
MQGLNLRKIALGLLVVGLLDLAISQPVNEDFTPSAFDFMIGTKEEYEVVPIHKSNIQKRSIDGRFHLELKAFGEHIKIWLEPNVGILATAETPIFKIDQAGRIQELDGLMNQIAGYLYYNEKEAATMFIKETPEGIYKLDGVIGGRGYSIHSIPDPSYNTNQLWYQTERFKRFIENTPEHERGNYTYHIVSKLPQVPDHLKTLKAPTLNFSRSKRALAPEVIYPEIMVVVDYSLFQKFKLNHYDVVKYLLPFWNSVDFKYRSLENPQYRLNIAGIMIAETPTSLSFMQHKLRYYPYDLLIEDALLDSADFVLNIEKMFKETHSFDAVVTITSHKVCAMKDGQCKRGTIGLAYVSGACNLPEMGWYQGKRVPTNAFKSSIVYDNAGYDGVNVAAHELGHLFGAEHDGEHHEACPLKTGHLMAPTVSFTANSSDWSLCAVHDMEKFLNSQSSKCLFNEPQSGTKLARFLPGRMMDADAQCRSYGNKKVYQSNENICVNLKCLDDQERFIYTHPGAADGTICGDNKICIQRQCIDLSKITY